MSIGKMEVLEVRKERMKRIQDGSRKEKMVYAVPGNQPPTGGGGRFTESRKRNSNSSLRSNWLKTNKIKGSDFG